MISELERMWKEAVMEIQVVISWYFVVWVEEDGRDPISGEGFETGPPQYES
jgi:hypothetical protein